MAAPTRKHKYVQDLKNWNLPRSEDIEGQIMEEIAGKTFAIRLDLDSLGPRLNKNICDRVRELNATVINENIETWVKGEANGNDDRFPESCFEFPYLTREKDADSLTVAYCVSNNDGSRIEIRRCNLDKLLISIAENDYDRPPQIFKRAMTVATRLRELADEFERTANAHAIA